ncbi:30S ribosomal protein S16 [Candidatus Rickettsiella isopodorum]|jgi:small subunit ribosomal protein S16|uniref:Small ribosomal subunit protein bS16 n=1 Tax=Candidatus Rickettsiella isopodorum TaxID=1225476 RepID=A0A1J8NFP8_9COXI|nr:30S ribosomal protein S16 [Candidatus Rickettsiella isopodorum]MCH9636842.1 30S ribosomal protein S16 [Gammaproteobacteria bacterium]MDQ5899720.1 small subunit ribosomal protein [Pseudomonadota bacterium]MCH9754332.1 30S ribosomal protein S16 [Gammaproteobacteria bacterium]MDD4893430.1 30S ribosomal protein S16 [Candidatus Rickettsiella isopodorum]MDD5162128.1 30S ribosomal protein S16 [Candidatus Rickettsiella isopodorum]
MVTIRLARGGRTERPFYHIVVTDSRKPRDGRYIERLGFYNPVAAGKEIELKITEDRVNYWLSQGAQPSEQVQSLLKKARKVANTKQTNNQAIAA